MARVEVRESEIEDIFAQYPVLLRRALKLQNDIFLVARQMALPSGRLDLVYSHLSELLLIELKVETFQNSFIDQVLGYKSDLNVMQTEGLFLQGDVTAVLMCPDLTSADGLFADARGVRTIAYDPGDVLNDFYRNAPIDTRYISVQPTDHGIWRIGLINDTIYLLNDLPSISEIARARHLSPKTIANQIRFAAELGLVRRNERKPGLSRLG